MARRGRPPSMKTLVDRQLGRKPIAHHPQGESFNIPNHSGISNHVEAVNAFVRRPSTQTSTDISVPIWDGTDAKTLKTSAVTIMDGNIIDCFQLQTSGVNNGIFVDDISESTSSNGIKVKHTLDMNSKKITNLADPANAQDGATKQFVLDNAGGAEELQILSIDYGTDTPIVGDEWGIKIKNASTLSKITSIAKTASFTFDVHRRLANNRFGANAATLHTGVSAGTTQTNTTSTASLSADDWLVVEIKTVSGTTDGGVITIHGTQD